MFFGGVDPANLTSRTLKALEHKDLEHLTVDVVIGQQSPHRENVLELAARRKCTTVHDPLPSLAGLITRADLAIGAGGATTWERACLKLPSLVVTIAENQKPFAKSLAEAGHIELLGDPATVSAETIHSALVARITNRVPSGNGSGSDLTDGHGTSRLTLAMLGPKEPIILRSAHEDDEALLMRWQNNWKEKADNLATSSVVTSGQQHSPSNSGMNKNQLCFIATMRNGCPVGHICIELKPFEAENVNSEAMIDLSLDRCCSDTLSLEYDLLRLGLKAMEKHGSQIIKATPNALQTNNSSKKFFGKTSRPENYPSDIGLTDFDSKSLALPPSRITILSDSSSWLNAYLAELVQGLWKRRHAVRWIHNPAQLSA